VCAPCIRKKTPFDGCCRRRRHVRAIHTLTDNADWLPSPPHVCVSTLRIEEVFISHLCTLIYTYTYKCTYNIHTNNYMQSAAVAATIYIWEMVSCATAGSLLLLLLLLLLLYIDREINVTEKIKKKKCF
jgi:hypothetical protein